VNKSGGKKARGGGKAKVDDDQDEDESDGSREHRSEEQQSGGWGFFSANDGQHRKVRERINATTLKWSTTAVLHETDSPHHDYCSQWRAVPHVGAGHCSSVMSFYLIVPFGWVKKNERGYRHFAASLKI
jgi:hypothetical protein